MRSVWAENVWNATETGTVTANLNAAGQQDTESDPISGSGTVTITQSGCSISYSPVSDSGFLAGTSSLVRTGTVSGNNVSVSGPLAVLSAVESAEEAENPGLTLGGVSVGTNTLTASGSISGSVLTLNGTGSFSASGSFSYQGESGSFTFFRLEYFHRRIPFSLGRTGGNRFA